MELTNSFKSFLAKMLMIQYSFKTRSMLSHLVKGADVFVISPSRRITITLKIIIIKNCLLPSLQQFILFLNGLYPPLFVFKWLRNNEDYICFRLDKSNICHQINIKFRIIKYVFYTHVSYYKM